MNARRAAKALASVSPLAVAALAVALGATACGAPAGPDERAALNAREGDGEDGERAVSAATRREPVAIDADSLSRLYARLPSDRSLASPGHAAARAFLLETLAAYGLQPRVLPFAWAGAPDADLANVELRLGPPTAPSGDEPPLLLVTAHYDSVAGTPGADDNGSGTVVLLELARRVAGRSVPIELRLVWFDAEEPGLIGSGHYVDTLGETERRRLMGVINLETMGYTDRRAGSQSLPPGARALFDPGDRGDFLLIVGNVSSALLGRAVSEGMQPEHGAQFRSELFALLPGAGWLFPDSRRSDHARFWDAQLPAVMLTDTANLRNPHYHRPSDTVATLDLPFLAAAARGVERAVLRLSESANTAPAGR